MHWIDWLIVTVPILAILCLAIYSKRFVRDVVDYLAAGRVAGRYVMTVGDMTSGLGIITLVALVEQLYHAGIAITFWNITLIPLITFFSLTGYCLYRFRESKALSNGQFLEMRYSRSFRIFASFLRILSELLTNAMGPAIAANFFIYYLGLPHTILIWGLVIPTFSLVVSVILILALLIILPAGRISLLITDCIQGLLCYPVFVIIAVFIMIKFSWDADIVPVLSDRVQGESFINPFDVSKLRDFNLVAVVVVIISAILNRASWAGGDASSAGRTPHEQKMGGILGTWRAGLSMGMCTLIALTLITVMNNAKFAPQAHEVRQELSQKVASEVAGSKQTRRQLDDTFNGIPVLTHEIGKNAPLSQGKDLDTVYMDSVQKDMGNSSEGNVLFQKFRSLYNQMMMPMCLRKILPVGLFGIFCLMAIMLMITTDDSRIFNSSAAIIQDMIVPFRKIRMSPRQHVRYVKWCSVFVALFFFVASLFFIQLDYINMILIIMASIWLGGAGPVMVFGLYSRFGNTVGAYCSLIFGSGTAISSVLIQRNWAAHVYPFLMKHDWVDPVGKFLETVSGPLNPYVVWKMDAVKCPINSYEFLFFSMMLGTIAYVTGSLLTYRKPYNLERLLHRGKYNTDGVANIKSSWAWKNVWDKLIGITPDYTLGDKIIVWLVFGYTFGFQIGLCFLVVLIWNAIHPWPDSWWSTYYFQLYFVATPIIALLTTVWFMWGGIIDTKRLFRDLVQRVDNPLDDGSVEGHVSVADIPLIGKDEDESDDDDEDK